MPKALTLIRPMPAAIVHGSKRIENRPMNLPRAMRVVSTVVAVHAGKKWDENYAGAMNQIDGDRRIDSEYRPAPSYAARCRDEGLVGLMRLTGRVHVSQDLGTYIVEERGTLTHTIPVENDPWYSGPFGYEIGAAVAFPTPILCRGMLGFWPVDEARVAQVREQCTGYGVDRELEELFCEWVGETPACPRCKSHEGCESECPVAPWNMETS